MPAARLRPAPAVATARGGPAASNTQPPPARGQPALCRIGAGRCVAGEASGGTASALVGGGPSNQPDATSWIDGSQDPACICIALYGSPRTARLLERWEQKGTGRFFLFFITYYLDINEEDLDLFPLSNM